MHRPRKSLFRVSDLQPRLVDQIIVECAKGYTQFRFSFHEKDFTTCRRYWHAESKTLTRGMRLNVICPLCGISLQHSVSLIYFTFQRLNFFVKSKHISLELQMVWVTCKFYAIPFQNDKHHCDSYLFYLKKEILFSLLAQYILRFLR